MMTAIWFLIKSLGVLILFGCVWYALSPVFGARLSTKALKVYEGSPQLYTVFSNAKPINMGFSWDDIRTAYSDYRASRAWATPAEGQPPVIKTNLGEFDDDQSETAFVWIGHSTFLLRMEQKTLLIDPMFSSVPSPISFIGGKRFNQELPFQIEQLDSVDFVLITHDHYDHLDFPSIKALAPKVRQFLVPLGIGEHLKTWGVPSEKIRELDWWEHVTMDALSFHLTPAQHFSGRAIADRFHTLWGSWVIKSATEALFFSGDSGYAPHFKEIGERLGPFDMAFVEAGQYNKRWPDVHMYPEESYLATMDVKAKAVMPIHWGAFSLAMHPWNEPAQKMYERAQTGEPIIVIPKIGEKVSLQDLPDTQPWW